MGPQLGLYLSVTEPTSNWLYVCTYVRWAAKQGLCSDSKVIVQSSQGGGDLKGLPLTGFKKGECYWST